ncbi:hypothetical protein O3G_MSEX000057 [Manduca sexta]|nr:hypothetical protein O3G_MSEX000057 [Manduca sexta]
MKGVEALIIARFLTLLSHLDVLISLLWESEKTVQHCLPMGYHEHVFQTYYRLLLAGYASSFFLIIVELMTFLSGLTLTSTNVAFICILFIDACVRFRFYLHEIF